GSLIPLTWVLGRRYPIRRPHLAGHLAIHAGGALLLCIGWATVGIALGTLLDTAPSGLAGWLGTSLPWSVFMYFAVLGCVHAVMYFNEAREREAHAAALSAQLSEARLAALRMQLHPHFLFNSLNALLVLVRDKDTPNAERMLELLGGVLRQVLQADASHDATLDEELQFLDDYLAIEQIRFSDRLTVVRDIAPETRRALVPRFVLQPLVENALRHGIGPLEGQGTLAISARVDGQDLVVAIADNGAGIVEPPNGLGVGLRNTRERLATLHGNRASLSLEPRNGGGTVATVRLPLRLAEDA
ncbi:MAG: histidine kinase, partial [Cytophagaceae bacterium]|nr:histidine kinase [Gemmatimonadaceae bacterium]